MSRSVKAHLLLILVTFIWGVTFVEIKDALADISPLLLNAIRMMVASFVLAAIYLPRVRRLSLTQLRAGAIVGGFLFLGYTFQTTGLRLTTPSKSAFLTGVSVILVPVIMAGLFGRRVNRWTLLGIAVAFFGLVLMTVPASAEAFADWSSINRGDLLTLGCAVAFAFHIVFLGRATQTHPFAAIAFIQVATAVALMLLTLPALESVHVVWSGRVLVVIAVTGVLGTAFAFSIQSWAQQFTPPSHTALIFALEPVFAWGASYLVLGERLGGRAAGGAALILGGVLLSELKGTPQESPESA